MESTAAWAVPYELQLAKNWTAEVAPADDDAQEVWAPAVHHPSLQYSSIIDIFGSSCSLQPYAVVPESTSRSSSGGPQLPVEYNCYNYCAAAAQHHEPTGKGTTTTPGDLMQSHKNSPMNLFQERLKKFDDAYDSQFMKQKMHRYPPSIRALDDDGLYTVPRVVAIGPYHHHNGGGHLEQAEEVKHAAACHCIMKSNRSVEEMYGAVISAVNDSNARVLYHTEVMAGLGDDCFLPMMFFDACFLVMYILKKSGADFDPKLYDFFESNENDIAHDIMLLENQIPLQVVDAVMNMCTAEPWETMKSFIAMLRKDGFLQDRAFLEFPRVDWDQDYYNKAPHLLGLVRFYAVGKRRRSGKPKVPLSDLKKMDSISLSVGAIELAEMGIFLTANDSTKLRDMGLARKMIFFKELSMAPLSLNDARASWLVNMAALELCTTPDFFDDKAGFEDSAVCSYLLLLCTLMHREEDVHELRAKGILQGGAGLTNKKTLDFFTGLQILRQGRCYYLVMGEIQSYRNNKRQWIKLYAFCYRNRKTIGRVATLIGGVMSIIITLIIKLKG